MAKKIWNLCDRLLTLCIAIVLLVVGAYAGYALWDNSQIYSAAEQVMTKMQALKPVIEEEGGGASFEELLAINSEVVAWITLDGTAIDYPVLQGENILSYINTDVYGNYSLSGSIFLDPTNDAAFTDAYCLIYGHHMAKHQMFGDLELYEEEDFFCENTTGILILPDCSYQLEIFACLVVAVSETTIFTPTLWQTELEGLLSFVTENALQLRLDVLAELLQDEAAQVLALSTCSSDFTDARTVLLARLVPA